MPKILLKASEKQIWGNHKRHGESRFDRAFI